MGLVEAWGGNPVGWFFANLIEAFYNFGYAVTHPSQWLSWVPFTNAAMADVEVKEALMRFIYYGASVELFFVVFAIFLMISIAGFVNNNFIWGCVRVLEGIANKVGRFFAWAGLLMVLQQIVIIFMQRIFAVSEIGIGFGVNFSKDVSWWSEELKLFNAMIVCMCASYTFVQGGHVRVDLVYSAVSFRTQRIIDMVGSLLFMVPAAILTWLDGWFFLCLYFCYSFIAIRWFFYQRSNVLRFWNSCILCIFTHRLYRWFFLRRFFSRRAFISFLWKPLARWQP